MFNPAIQHCTGQFHSLRSEGSLQTRLLYENALLIKSTTRGSAASSDSRWSFCSITALKYLGSSSRLVYFLCTGLIMLKSWLARCFAMSAIVGCALRLTFAAKERSIVCQRVCYVRHFEPLDHSELQGGTKATGTPFKRRGREDQLALVKENMTTYIHTRACAS